MVVALRVRIRWSLQSDNTAMEPHEKLTSIEHIVTVTQHNPLNGIFSHQKAVRIWYCHAHNTRIILLFPSSQIRNTNMFPFRQEYHPHKTELRSGNATTCKKQNKNTNYHQRPVLYQYTL